LRLRIQQLIKQLKLGFDSQLEVQAAPASHLTVTTLLHATLRWKYFALIRIFKLSVLPLPTAAGVTVHSARTRAF
jgi:hypothetical protein